VALQVTSKRTSRFQPIRIVVLIILVILLVATGWYSYRWYVAGDPFPVPVPAFATANPDIDESEVTATQVKDHTVPPLQPRYISIPTIGVSDTRVFGVGVESDGALGVPANISDAAWYNKSSTPGSGGVVLIDAHNGGVTRDGVFAKLGTLKKGDSIVVERGDGKKFTYQVQENQSMPLDEVNATGMKMMMESAVPGKEALNLITCDGKWVPRLKQFDRRIMLRAVLVDSK
jgi:LPXTG-site transpeptidase (sortase) family protein